jgi:hypothetical protein
MLNEGDAVRVHAYVALPCYAVLSTHRIWGLS